MTPVSTAGKECPFVHTVENKSQRPVQPAFFPSPFLYHRSVIFHIKKQLQQCNGSQTHTHTHICFLQLVFFSHQFAQQHLVDYGSKFSQTGYPACCQTDNAKPSSKANYSTDSKHETLLKEPYLSRSIIGTVVYGITRNTQTCKLSNSCHFDNK